MTRLCTIFVLLLLALTSRAGNPTTARVYTDASKTEEVLDWKQMSKEYLLHAPLTKECLEGVVKMVGFSITPYHIAVSFEGNEVSEGFDGLEFYTADGEAQPGFHSLQKRQGYVEYPIDGEKLRKSMVEHLEAHNWPAGKLTLHVKLVSQNDSGEPIVVSRAITTIEGGKRGPAYIHFKGALKARHEAVYKKFTSGTAANTLRNRALAAAVEYYFETRWPNEDITTVNLTGMRYQDTSMTDFSIDGYYISQKDGECFYSSFYGDGLPSMGGYSVTWFNSLDQEELLDCTVAERLRNR